MDSIKYVEVTQIIAHLRTTLLMQGDAKGRNLFPEKIEIKFLGEEVRSYPSPNRWSINHIIGLLEHTASMGNRPTMVRIQLNKDAVLHWQGQSDSSTPTTSSPEHDGPDKAATVPTSRTSGRGGKTRKES